LIRRIRILVSRHGADGVLAALLIVAAGAGALFTPSALGKFIEVITPDIAAQASDAPIPRELRHLPLRADPVIPPTMSQPLPAESRAMSDTPPVAMATEEGPSSVTRAAHEPVIAICIDDLGEDVTNTDRAIVLPREVTLSFLPYAGATPALAQKAEREGHEVLAHVPMEPLGNIDPGPMTLKVGAPDIAERLAWSLARVPGLSGINNHEGSKFSSDAASLAPVAAMLSARHLFFFDSRTIAGSQVVRVAHDFGVASAGRDVFLDNVLTDSAIESRLNELAAKARKSGVAIAIGHPHDITLRLLAAWLAQDHGIQLVPVSQAIRLKTESRAIVALR
jgi:polysaccharide deacetylase 2 family uncharacterized protein YibQ